MRTTITLGILISITLFTCHAWAGSPSGSSPAIKGTDGSKAPLAATADMYFDIRTGHRYVKNFNGTYSEYTRKGAFFKIVPSSCYLLTDCPKVIMVSKTGYFLYSKKVYGLKAEYIAVSTDQPHPKGWILEKLLTAAN